MKLRERGVGLSRKVEQKIAGEFGDNLYQSKPLITSRCFLRLKNYTNNTSKVNTKDLTRIILTPGNGEYKFNVEQRVKITQ